MKWFQIKERAAGDKRLWLTWQIYKIFGKNAVKFIAFIVTACTFAFAKDLRNYSKKYLRIVGVKPTLVNRFKHIFNYSLSLVDKLEIFTNNFDFNKIIFEKPEDEASVYSDFDNKKGLFFICSHLGNVDVMRAFLTRSEEAAKTEVMIFLNKEHCKTFNDYMQQVATIPNVTAYAIEEIDMNTAIEIKEKLDKGSIIFMAGDRVSKSNETAVFEGKLFGRTVEFPIGTFRLAQMMDVQTYFITALKSANDKYVIHLQKMSLEGEKRKVVKMLQEEYLRFIEEKTLLEPLQFYHFYDLFKN